MEERSKILPSRLCRIDYLLACILVFAITLGLFILIPSASILLSLLAKAALIILHIKRLHDFGVNGWWSMMTFVPFFGELMILGFCFIPGDDEENEYGPPQRIKLNL